MLQYLLEHRRVEDRLMQLLALLKLTLEFSRPKMSNDPNVGSSPARSNKFDMTNSFDPTTKIIQLLQ